MYGGALLCSAILGCTVNCGGIVERNIAWAEGSSGHGRLPHVGLVHPLLNRHTEGTMKKTDLPLSSPFVSRGGGHSRAIYSGLCSEQSNRTPGMFSLFISLFTSEKAPLHLDNNNNNTSSSTRICAASPELVVMFWASLSTPEIESTRRSESISHGLGVLFRSRRLILQS